MGGRRGRLYALLASSSVAALLIGGGAPPAYAACSTNFFNGQTAAGCSNAAIITGISINNSTITGDVVNTPTGTIDPNGITLTNASTITGSILNDGSIAGNITIDATSKITGTQHDVPG